MLEDFLVPFAVILFSELGDKSQIAIFMLASRTRNQIRLLSGVLLAFLIVDGIAVLAGDIVTSFMPVEYVKIVFALSFIAFGIYSIMNAKDGGKFGVKVKSPFLSGFVMIFLAEWGDKTQMASGLFAAKYDAMLVLMGVMAAMLALSIAAIYFGKAVVKKFGRKNLSKISGLIFIAMGILALIAS